MGGNWQRLPFAPWTKDEAPLGMATVRCTDCAGAGPLLTTLIVYRMSAFVCAGLGETLCVTARSASEGAATFRPADAVNAVAPLAAPTLKVCGPVSAEFVVETVSVEVCGEALVMLRDAGWKLAVAPGGRLEALSVTVPVKPLRGVIVTS